MPNYAQGKIYKLQCDDGHFYIGSTATELRFRFNRHKHDSKVIDSRAYQHIKTIGWNRVRIVLVEEFPCESKLHLRRREDELIRASMSDPFCLNMRVALQQDGEHNERRKAWNESHKEHKAEYWKKWYAAKKARQTSPPS